MSYLVLARKWRPKLFQELIGQEILSQTLKNAVIQNRVAQAFLFCGSRGTGKTSCARILAKALACQNPVEGEPCGVCKNCQVINQGNSADIVEIDAASNRGIENIRRIRENLAYLPIQNKFKVYIIDEAHMLTLESFNALLKSLEEPPAHVKFILATTEPKKIPQTIQSRCQRYDFHNITTDKIKTHLSHITQQEEMDISDMNLEKIAKNAGGAMRDALTSLDMLLAFCGKQIKDENLSQILEITENKDLEELLVAIIKQNTTDALMLFKNLCNKGTSLQIILSDFLILVHKISLLKSCPQSNIKEPLQSVALQENLIHTSLSKLQQYFQILLEVEQQGRVSQFPMLCVEMGIIKMCSVESLVRVQDILHQLEKEQAEKGQVEKGQVEKEQAQKEQAEKEQISNEAVQNQYISSEKREPTDIDIVVDKDAGKENIAEQNIAEKPVSVSEPIQGNQKLQTGPETTPIKDLNFENYERFVTDLKTKYPTSVKIEQLEQLKFQKFMGKKLILTSNESLFFWTDGYKVELENYLTQLFSDF